MAEPYLSWQQETYADINGQLRRLGVTESQFIGSTPGTSFVLGSWLLQELISSNPPPHSLKQRVGRRKGFCNRPRRGRRH